MSCTRRPPPLAAICFAILAKSKICRLAAKGQPILFHALTPMPNASSRLNYQRHAPIGDLRWKKAASPRVPILMRLAGLLTRLTAPQTIFMAFRILPFRLPFATREKSPQPWSLTRFAMNISLPRPDQVPMSMTADCAFPDAARWANLFLPPAFRLSGAAVMKTMRFLPANYSISWVSAPAYAGLARPRLTLPMSLQGGLTAIGNMG